MIHIFRILIHQHYIILKKKKKPKKIEKKKKHKFTLKIQNKKEFVKIYLFPICKKNKIII